MFAQSLIEYGSLSSLTAGFQRFAYYVRSSIRDTDTQTWLIAGGVVLAAYWLFGRRR